MNEISWITPLRGRQNGGGHRATYAFYLTNNKAGGKKAEIQGSIRVSEKAMKKLRWIAGDRVLIGRDDTHLYIKRVQSGGYSLSAVGGLKNAGKATACSVKSSRLSFPFPTEIAEGDYAVLDDGTVMLEVKSDGC